MRENLKKISIVIKNVIGPEDTKMHNAESHSNYILPTLSHMIRLSR